MVLPHSPFLFALAVGFLLSLQNARGQETGNAPALRPPNIILILVDDLGYGDLGCYGASKQATPNIDRLAAEGARLTDFYVSAPVCSPSRAAFLTGCYHKRIGVNHVFWPVSKTGLNPNEVTIAEILRARGYATRYFGKWHLGDQKVFLPTRQGFDHNLGIPYSHDMGSMVRVKKESGRLNPLHMRVVPVLRDEKVEELVKDVGPLMSVYEQELIEFIGASGEQPFFAMLAQHAVHLPNEPSKSYRGISQNGDYGDWLHELDDSVGRILAALEESGLDRQTLVLLTSDNGPAKKNNGTAAPLRGTKHTTWEGGVRVPFVARWPGTIPPGQVRREIVACMDLLPTLAAISGGSLSSVPGTIDGVNVAPLLLGTQLDAPPRQTFAYYQRTKLMAVRHGRWKLHLKAPDGRENVLFDLQADVAETTDLAADYPAVVRQLLDIAGPVRLDLGDGRKKGIGVRSLGHAAKLRPLFQATSHPSQEDE